MNDTDRAEQRRSLEAFANADHPRTTRSIGLTTTAITNRPIAGGRPEVSSAKISGDNANDQQP